MFGIDPIDPTVTAALQSLAQQLEAGLRLDRALRGAATVVASSRGRSAFEQAAERAASNAGFDAVLQALAPVLSFAERSLIWAEWEAGQVESAIKQVAGRRRTLHATRRKVRGQLIKPAFILVAGVCVIPLPPLLLGRIGVGSYVVQALTPLALVAAVIFVISTLMRAQSRRWSHWQVGQAPPPAGPIDRLAISLPALRRTVRQRSLSEFGLAMAALLRAGLNTDRALAITAQSLPNGVYRQATAEAAAHVAAGKALPGALPRHLWPTMWRQSLEIADEAGAEEKVLERLGQAAQEDYLETVRAWGAFIPWAAYIILSIYLVMQILAGWGVSSGAFAGFF